MSRLWSIPTSGSGGSSVSPFGPASSKTANFTAADYNVYIINSSGGSFNVQLPAPASKLVFVVTDIGNSLSSNPVTFLRNAAEKIQNTAASYVWYVDLGTLIWYSDGVNWYLL